MTNDELTALRIAEINRAYRNETIAGVILFGGLLTIMAGFAALLCSI